MDRIEKLREARTSTSVQFMDFMKAISRDRSILVCFFEGEDEKYYSVRINTILVETKWTGINCGGKSKVIELRNKIRSHVIYKKSYVAFFIDNDFSDDHIDNTEDYYITPCYSVENLYSNVESFERIIAAEFGMSNCCSQSDDFEIAVSMFKSRLSDFCKVILPFNIWIKAHRALEKKSKDKSNKLNLNNIKIEDLVSITLSEVLSVYDCDNISKLFPKSLTITSDTYQESATYFNKENIEHKLRGKQQLEFLRVFLTHLREERSKNGNATFSRRTPIKLQLSKANTISELSQYANTPKCLVTYLKNLPI